MFGLTTFASTNNRPLQIRVVGHQWWWEFDYLNEHIVTADGVGNTRWYSYRSSTAIAERHSQLLGS